MRSLGLGDNHYDDYLQALKLSSATFGVVLAIAAVGVGPLSAVALDAQVALVARGVLAEQLLRAEAPQADQLRRRLAQLEGLADDDLVVGELLH